MTTRKNLRDPVVQVMEDTAFDPLPWPADKADVVATIRSVMHAEKVGEAYACWASIGDDDPHLVLAVAISDPLPVIRVLMATIKAPFDLFQLDQDNEATANSFFRENGIALCEQRHH